MKHIIGSRLKQHYVLQTFFLTTIQNCSEHQNLPLRLAFFPRIWCKVLQHSAVFIKTNWCLFTSRKQTQHSSLAYATCLVMLQWIDYSWLGLSDCAHLIKHKTELERGLWGHRFKSLYCVASCLLFCVMLIGQCFMLYHIMVTRLKLFETQQSVCYSDWSS